MTNHPIETISATLVHELMPGMSSIVGCFPSSAGHYLNSWTLNYRILELPKPLERRQFPHFENWDLGRSRVRSGLLPDHTRNRTAPCGARAQVPGFPLQQSTVNT